MAPKIMKKPSLQKKPTGSYSGYHLCTFIHITKDEEGEANIMKLYTQQTSTLEELFKVTARQSEQLAWNEAEEAAAWEKCKVYIYDVDWEVDKKQTVQLLELPSGITIRFTVPKVGGMDFTSICEMAKKDSATLRGKMIALSTENWLQKYEI